MKNIIYSKIREDNEIDDWSKIIFSIKKIFYKKW